MSETIVRAQYSGYIHLSSPDEDNVIIRTRSQESPQEAGQRVCLSPAKARELAGHLLAYADEYDPQEKAETFLDGPALLYVTDQNVVHRLDQPNGAIVRDVALAPKSDTLTNRDTAILYALARHSLGGRW